jgi:hypothetical protein
LVGFENDGIIRIEKFPDNNRPDHFTMFGHNATFVNESLANKLRLKLIKLRF